MPTEPIGEPGSGPRVPFSILTDADVLSLWADAMSGLRRRGPIRTANNPVADYGGHVAVGRLGSTLQGSFTAAYDAIGLDGTRCRITARRLTHERWSRQPGTLRDLDAGGFDVLVVVQFEPNFAVLGVWSVPIAVVRGHVAYQAHVNAHVPFARPSLLNELRVTRVQ